MSGGGASSARRRARERASPPQRGKGRAASATARRGGAVSREPTTRPVDARWRAQESRFLKERAQAHEDAAADRGERLAAALAEAAVTASRIDLPHRDAMEQAFGRSLGDLDVRSSPEIAAILESLGAQAAVMDGVMLLPAPQVELAVVAHETAHLLAPPGAPPLAAATLPPADHETETQAERAADAVLRSEPVEAPVARQPRGALALRRAPDRSEPAAPDQSLAFDAAAPKSPEPAADAGDAAGGGPSADADAGLDVPPEQAGAFEPKPNFQPEPMPETELSAEEKAQREAKAKAAVDAIENAETAQAAVDAFASAPPAVKARRYREIGDRMGEAAAKEDKAFGDELPKFAAEMSGDAEPPAPKALQMPQEPPGALEPTPKAAQLPDLPQAPPPTPTRMNSGLERSLDKRADTHSREGVSNALEEVDTGNPGVETKLGDRPKVPRKDDTDPQRLERQKLGMSREAEAARARAAQAVADGPGPETVTPRQLKQDAPVRELVKTAASPIQPVGGAEEFAQMGLPEEAVAAFEGEAAAKMEESFAPAKDRMSQAVNERDDQRKTEVGKAETERDRLQKEADDGQRGAVKTARDGIQGDRQKAVDDQQTAVQTARDQAQQKQGEESAKVETRLREDEGRVETEYAAREAEADREVSKGEEKAEARKRQAERESENQSWWERGLSALRSAFNAVVGAINSIFDAVRSAVRSALNAAKAFAAQVIKAAAAFIKTAINLFASALTGLVNGLLGDVLPGLAKRLTEGIESWRSKANAAVDKIADVLIAGINALVDVLANALDAILAVFQGAINFVGGLIDAALAGDWGAFGRMLLEGVLKTLGVNPESFYAFIGKVSGTIMTIVRHPGTFLGNVVGAVDMGFRLFADRFLTHLRNGIIAWLTGALGDIQMPARWNLMGMLDLARQVLGLTWEWLKQRAKLIVGEKNVERLEAVFGWIGTLATKGWSGFFDEIKDQLAGLKDMVLEQIKSFLVERIVIAGITWVVSLFNPIGAIIKLVMTIWNLIQFVRDQMQRLIGIFQALTGGLSNIVAGNLAPAANAVEKVLGNLLPVAIGLIATLLGLNGVAARVRKMIGGVRKRIAKAADKLIKKIMGRSKGKKGGTKKAKDKGKGKSKTVELGKKVTIPVKGGKPHTLFVEMTGPRKAKLMMRSKKQEAKKGVSEIANDIAAMPKGPEKTKGKAAAQKAEQGVIAVEKEIVQAVDVEKPKKKGEAPVIVTPAEDKAVEQKEEQAAPHIGLALSVVAGAPLYSGEVGQLPEPLKSRLQAALAEATNRQAFQGRSWVQAIVLIGEGKALDKVENFDKPLSGDKGYAQEIKQAIRARLPGWNQDKAIPNLPAQAGDHSRALGNGFVRQINAGQHPVARKVIIMGMLRRSSAKSVARHPAVEQAVRDAFQGGGAKPPVTPALKTAVGGGRAAFLGFLDAMSANRPRKGYTPAQFHAIFANRKGGEGKAQAGVDYDYLATRFRNLRGGGEHEWIPTAQMEQVILTASRARAAGDAVGARAWIRFYEMTRSPTKDVIFKPKAELVRSISSYKHPDHKGKRINRATTIPQGHPGALYAPVSSSGYEDSGKTQQQIIGHDGWNNRLVAAARAGMQDSSIQGVRTARDGILRIFNETVWSGSDTFVNIKGAGGPADGFDQFEQPRGVSKTFASIKKDQSAKYQKMRGVIENAVT